jgi:hypothetical protein
MCLLFPSDVYVHSIVQFFSLSQVVTVKNVLIASKDNARCMYCQTVLLPDSTSTMHMTPTSAVSHTVDIIWPLLDAVYSAATIRTTYVRQTAY